MTAVACVVTISSFCQLPETWLEAAVKRTRPSTQKFSTREWAWPPIVGKDTDACAAIG